MHQFITKIFLFFVPFILLTVNYMTYKDSGGDLSRLGKVSFDDEYRAQFEEEYSLPDKTTALSSIDLSQAQRFDILTIGDSFSQYGTTGYQNYLANRFDLSIVNVDNGYKRENPIQMLFQIANGDILDHLKVDYIVLQSVERDFGLRAEQSDPQKAIHSKDFNRTFEAPKSTGGQSAGFGLFHNIINYTLFNVLYNFDSRAFFSNAYKVNTADSTLFSTQENEMLFYYKDVKHIVYNTEAAAKTANKMLNLLHKKLNAKGVELIVLPSPDKYNVYAEYIEDDNLPENDFLKTLEQLDKDYIYVNTEHMLTKNIERGVQDVYYADDSHWSPVGQKLVAKHLYREITNTKDGYLSNN